MALIQAATTHEDHPLFPKLHKLVVNGASGHLDHLRLFFSSALAKLTLIKVLREQANTSWFTALKRQSSHVDLHIDQNSLPKSLIRVLASWTYVGKVSIDDTSLEALVALSLLPALRDLSVHLSSLEITDYPQLRPGGFLSLTHLEVSSPIDFSPCLPILAVLTKSPLHRLWLLSEEQSAKSLVATVIEAISHYLKGSSLEELLLSDYFEVDYSDYTPFPDDKGRGGDDPISIHTLRVLPNLKSLTFEIKNAVAIGIEPLRLLAAHGIALERFTIVNYYMDRYAWPYEPRIKLRDLVEILRYFPSLTTFGSLIDVTGVGIGSSRPGGGLQHRIKKLEVSCSPIDSPGIVAAFLSDFMPNLKYIGACGSSTAEGDEDEGGVDDKMQQWGNKWDEAKELVKIFALVRRHERAYCSKSRH
jgi:hypothetical protein